MKLSRLYSSQEDKFPEIIFNDSLNIILAEIRKPKDSTKSTHDLGKSLLVSLINYCLLQKVTDKFFLNKQYEIFQGFDFYLEIKNQENEFITICRSVRKKSKVRIWISNESSNEINRTTPIFNGFLNNAKFKLNDLLFLDIPSDKTYRDYLMFSLRDQISYSEVFRTSKNFRSKDIYWKPKLAGLLGFDEDSVYNKYLKDAVEKNEAEKKKEARERFNENLKLKEQYEMILLDKKIEALQFEKEIETYNYQMKELFIDVDLVKDIDANIKVLMNQNYYLNSQIENAKKSLANEKLEINFNDIEQLYNEINIYFSENLLVDYENLINFNKQVSEERIEIYIELIEEYTPVLLNNKEKIKSLNLERSKMLSYLSTENYFEKLKMLEANLIDKKVEILSLEDKLNNLNFEKNELIDTDEKEDYVNSIKRSIEDSKIFKKVKKYFCEIIYDVLGEFSDLKVYLNKNKNIEFDAEILDKNNKKKDKDKGLTYKKLMCCAFDLALLATYSQSNFIKFVYHDGVFDGLDNRQSENLYRVIQNYINEYNIQYILSSIQDQLPPIILKEIPNLKQNHTIVRTLHDDGEEGRLFTMEAF